MPWRNDRESRRRSDSTYKHPEYQRNRRLAWERSRGRCEWQAHDGHPCGSATGCQVDHVVPVSRGGSHALANLRVLCSQHHQAKTATEGGGFRNGKPSDPPHRSSTRW